MKKVIFKNITNPKVAVVGCGAIGATLGGLLIREGIDVVFLDKLKKVEKLNNEGLFIKDKNKKFHLKVKAKTELEVSPDILILAVKITDLNTICKSLRYIAKDSIIINVQNGVRSESITALTFRESQIVSMVLNFNANMISQNQVYQQLTDVKKNEIPIIMGDYFNKNYSEKMKSIELFNKIAQVEWSNNIICVKYTKLLMNITSNSINALTNQSLQECMENSKIRRIVAKTLKESYSVIKASNINLKSISNFKVTPFSLLVRMPTRILSIGLKFIMGSKKYSKNVTSTLQSLKKGRKSEIDYLNGEIVILGKQKGILTPYNLKIIHLIKKIETNNTFFTFEELIDIFD